MGKKRRPGLQKSDSGTWTIDKWVLGKRIFERTGTTDYDQAERRLDALVAARRDAVLNRIRPPRSLSSALKRWCDEHSWNPDDVYHCRILDEAAGTIDIAELHMGSLQPLIKDRLAGGAKKKTVNLTLGKLRAILNTAATDWIDDTGLTWLKHPPKIKLLLVDDAAKPYPLNWDEERQLFSLLPPHYQRPCVYGVNTGLREDLLCGLEWQWEYQVPELGRSVFLIPGETSGVKNGEDWLVVHNRAAQSVIESVRGMHDRYVFAYGTKRLYSLTNTAWQKAWIAAGLPTDASKWRKGVHNLRHTFGHRLRAVGVSNETRHALLHHKSRDMSTHYSVPEIRELVEAVDRLCEARAAGTTVLRLVAHAKVTQAK